MKEIFKRYNDRIEVSDCGNVKVDGKDYDLEKCHAVYKRVHNLYVHRMVAELFIPNPENKSYVDHIDGDRYNNHVTNLRWATPSENRLNPISVARLAETNKKEDVHNRRVKVHQDYCKNNPEGVFFHKGHIPWNKYL